MKVSYIACVIVDVAICITVLGAIYFTKNPWCLLALLLLMGVKPVKGKCPKCGETVVFEEAED